MHGVATPTMTDFKLQNYVPERTVERKLVLLTSDQANVNFLQDTIIYFYILYNKYFESFYF